MQVTHVTKNYAQPRNNINFNGIQRIKVNLGEYMIAEKEIFPAIRAKENGFLKYIQGPTPYEELKYRAVEFFGKLNNAGIEWAVNFAECLGLKVPFDNPVNTLLIVTGEKDINKVENYIAARNNEYLGRMKKHLIRNRLFTPVENCDAQLLVSNFTELDKEAAYFNEFANAHGARNGNIFSLFVDQQLFSPDKEADLIQEIFTTTKLY